MVRGSEGSRLWSACDSSEETAAGAILYNANLRAAENWVTALADAVRVADDYSTFASQYRRFRQQPIGQHWSWRAGRRATERGGWAVPDIAGRVTEADD